MYLKCIWNVLEIEIFKLSLFQIQRNVLEMCLKLEYVSSRSVKLNEYPPEINIFCLLLGAHLRSRSFHSNNHPLFLLVAVFWYTFLLYSFCRWLSSEMPCCTQCATRHFKKLACSNAFSTFEISCTRNPHASYATAFFPSMDYACWKELLISTCAHPHGRA